jgi:hypothetical protein
MKIHIKGNQPQSNKKFKSYKPYWSKELTKLWKDMNNGERVFLECKGPKKWKSRLRKDFKLRRRLFDRKLKRSKREYERKLVNNLDNINTTNHREFWKTLKN